MSLWPEYYNLHHLLEGVWVLHHPAGLGQFIHHEPLGKGCM